MCTVITSITFGSIKIKRLLTFLSPWASSSIFKSNYNESIGTTAQSWLLTRTQPFSSGVARLRKTGLEMEQASGNETGLPHFAEGVVIKGFGRGSKELGIPTANFSIDVVEKLPKQIDSGVYYGFASVNNGPIYKMVMSVGWNPYYNNKVKSMETYVIHKFDQDFYGEHLKIVMLGFIRPQLNFKSLDELISAIKSDVEHAEKALEDDKFAEFRKHSFFQQK